VRKDHRPSYLKKWLARLNDRYVARYLAPQFDSLGGGFEIRNPRCVEVMGPNIHAGRRLHVMATSDAPVRLIVWPESGGRIQIGDYVALSPGVRITCSKSITIGHGCSIAQRVFITDADWHDLYHRIYPGKEEPVVLEDNVWLGDQVIVTKGVRIGRNSIVGAGSVVTRDVPANAIAAGNPANVVKELDPGHPITTRAALFEGPQPYEIVDQAFDEKYLATNTLAGWLRSMWRPDRTM
jgi:acetyltransferase-like isoleucine patch superfamily enzyme